MASSSSAMCFALLFLFILTASTSAGTALAQPQAGERCSPCQAGPCSGKSEWPELVGTKGSEARKIIQRENPNVKHVIYIWCTWKRVMDCCCNRLWLFVDGDAGGNHGKGRVCTTPRVG